MLFAVAFADAECALEDALAATAEHAADSQQLAGIGVGAGNVAAIRHLVQERPGGRETQCAGADGFVDQFGHLGHVVVGRRGLVQAALAHGVDAHRAVADHAADVDALVHPVDGFEVLAVGLPVPGQSGVDGFLRDVLHGLHHLRQVAAVLGLAGREGDAAVADDHGGDAVVAGRRGDGIPGDLGVQVRVDVHEPGRDDLAGGVDLAPALPADLADGDDAIALHGDIAPVAGCTGAVDQGAVSDDQVVCHGGPFIG